LSDTRPPPSVSLAPYPGVVIDCPEPVVLAGFHGALLDWGVKVDDGWAQIHPADGSNRISFQQVADAGQPRVAPPEDPAAAAP
jgi:hypothetical protein